MHTTPSSCVALTVTAMKGIGTRIFDDAGVPPEKRRYELRSFLPISALLRPTKGWASIFPPSIR